MVELLVRKLAEQRLEHEVLRELIQLGRTRFFRGRVAISLGNEINRRVSDWARNNFRPTATEGAGETQTRGFAPEQGGSAADFVRGRLAERRPGDVRLLPGHLLTVLVAVFLGVIFVLTADRAGVQGALCPIRGHHEVAPTDGNEALLQQLLCWVCIIVDPHITLMNPPRHMR